MRPSKVTEAALKLRGASGFLGSPLIDVSCRRAGAEWGGSAIAMDFRAFMHELSRCAKEPPIEPAIEHGAAQFAKAREQAELADGVVTKVVVRAAPGGAEGTDAPARPEEGSLVIFHYAIRRQGSTETLASSRGAAPATFVVGKGRRMPRGLEVALMSMAVGETSSFTIAPSYGFRHPACSWQPEAVASAAGDAPLDFDIELMDVAEPNAVSVIAPIDGGDEGASARRRLDPSATTSVRAPIGIDAMVIKRILRDGTGWENPRPPYEVVVACAARRSDADQAAPFFEATQEAPLRFACGSGAVPPALEEAIMSMFKGEAATVYCMAPPPTSPLVPSAFPPPPSDATSACGPSGPVIYEVELEDVIQVRDVLGNGEIMKHRVTKGDGEFPIDCPIADCTVAIRCVGRAKQTSAVLFDASACASADASGVLRVETGTGVLPSGLEMCIKLMVPGEVSQIDCKAQHAYDGPHDPSMLTSSVPQGMDVVWRVTLVSFDKPIDLGSPEVASEEAMEEARRRKALGNDLFRSGKVALAKAKYEGLLRDVRRVCGVTESADAEELEAMGLSCQLNLAACALKLNDPADAIKHCDKVLETHPENAKALYRRGQARTAMSEWAGARCDFEAMMEADPTTREEGEGAMQRIARLEKAALACEREQFAGFLSKAKAKP